MDAVYRAARAGAVVFDQPEWGRVEVAGRDRLDFLQRMSTNDLAGLVPGQGRATVLTTPIGRMVDRVVVYVDAETLLMVTSPGMAEAVRRWLGRHVFFNDQLTLVDRSAETGLLRVVGPESGAHLQAVLGADLALPAAAHDWAPAEHAGARLLVARGDALGAECLVVVGPAAALAGLRDALLAGGAPAGDGALYEVLRVEAGLPAIGREISEEHIPLEANLWGDVSFRKGCYIGQEIIARMESRGRQARVLAGLTLAAPLEPAGDLTVRHGDETVGQVSSTVVSPASGPIALAFLKPAAAEPGMALVVGEGIGATVRDLPFA
jgi:aminomethyltransferase